MAIPPHVFAAVNASPLAYKVYQNSKQRSRSSSLERRSNIMEKKRIPRLVTLGESSKENMKKDFKDKWLELRARNDDLTHLVEESIEIEERVKEEEERVLRYKQIKEMSRVAQLQKELEALQKEVEEARAMEHDLELIETEYEAAQRDIVEDADCAPLQKILDFVSQAEERERSKTFACITEYGRKFDELLYSQETLASDTVLTDLKFTEYKLELFREISNSVQFLKEEVARNSSVPDEKVHLVAGAIDSINTKYKEKINEHFQSSEIVCNDISTTEEILENVVKSNLISEVDSERGRQLRSILLLRECLSDSKRAVSARSTEAVLRDALRYNTLAFANGAGLQAKEDPDNILWSPRVAALFPVVEVNHEEEDDFDSALEPLETLTQPLIIPSPSPRTETSHYSEALSLALECCSSSLRMTKGWKRDAKETMIENNFWCSNTPKPEHEVSWETVWKPMMTNGQILIKINRSGKAQTRFVAFSNEMNYLYLRDVDSMTVKAKNRHSVDNIVSVLPGYASDIWLKSKQYRSGQDSTTCLTVIFNDKKTLNLQTASAVSRDQWLDGISYAVHRWREVNRVKTTEAL